MPEQRPNPEKLLKKVQEEERQQQRGRLKIYLGAAPGVGKTYTMLQDAIAKRTQGLDVVIGIVESHGREEINSLIKNFEVLPRQQVEYRGKQLTEFDLDAALKRNPGLILVDEMAHTNIPDLRHAKRWQDIKEILDRGIDVYTTLNIQHVESLNDIVSQIIHAHVKETVPDSMLELADTIELVDLAPEDLLKRLQDGKVYFPQQAELAAENFFRKGNLIALRELALRTTAQRVGSQVLLYRQDQGIRHIWPTKEKILVCVGARSESIKLIRVGRRMAANLQAEWIAVHVDTPRIKLEEEQRNSAIQNLRLAEQLGAETKILTGFDVIKEIMDFAHEQNITRIVIGMRIRPRWKSLFIRSLTDEITRQSGEIEVHIITNTNDDAKPPTKPTSASPPKNIIPWKLYGISLAIVAATTFIDLLLSPYIHTSNLIMVYLLGVTIVALFGRVGPSILASVLSVFLYGIFFTPPLQVFSLSDAQYIFTLVVMLLVTQVISQLTILLRRQAQAARHAEQRTAVLHTLSRQLASTRGVDKLLETTVRYIGDYFNSEIILLLSDNNHLKVRARYKSEQILNEKELSIAQWVYDLEQVAGRGTDTLPFSDGIYVPLLASQGAIGVMRLHPAEQNHFFSPEQMHLLEACANQIAIAIEVDRLQDQAKKSEVETEADKARNALLQAVSHDLRTPLIAIMGSASTQIELADELEPRAIKKLGHEIYLEADQLSRLINNLLQITYLESDEIKLQKQSHSLSDVITFVVNSSSKRLRKKSVNIKLPDNLPKIPFDATLIQEVFINLIDNAVKFTPTEIPIDISAIVENDQVIVSIEDHGPGIVPDEVGQLFEKFYRGRLLTTERGLGLGLAICRSIIKAHGGEIWAENRSDGGAIFRFTLPCNPKNS